MSLFEGFNKRFHDELKEEIQSVETVILAGNLQDLAEYKRLVGKRLGLVQALERHKELLTLMDQANDN